MPFVQSGLFRSVGEDMAMTKGSFGESRLTFSICRFWAVTASFQFWFHTALSLRSTD